MSIQEAGYALTRNADGGWSYRGVDDSWPLAEGEIFYHSYQEFPQEAKDWFAAQQI